MYKTLDKCEDSVKSQYLDFSQNYKYQVVALSYNSTLTDFVGKDAFTLI